MGFTDALRIATMFSPSRSKTLNSAWSPVGPGKKSPWESMNEPKTTPFENVNFMPNEQEESEPQTRSSVDNYMSRMNEIENADTPALRRYRTHLEQTPEEGDYRPGGWTRFAAALGGLSAGMRSGAGAGFQTAYEMNRRPYESALENWGLKGKGLKEEADLEIESQRDRLKNLQAAMSYDLNERKFMDTSERGWETIHNTRKYQEGNLRERGRTNDINAGRASSYATDVANRGKYQQGQLGLGRDRNAIATRGQNLSYLLGSERNDIARGRADATGNKPFRVVDQQRASDMALEELAKDPIYGKYVKEVGKDNLGRPVYDSNLTGNATANGLFLAELEARKRRILNYGGKGSQNPQSPDDDMELDDEEEDEFDIY